MVYTIDYKQEICKKRQIIQLSLIVKMFDNQIINELIFG